jgi:hypothetical protein
MSQVSRTSSKAKFQSGDIPTENDFIDLHDSTVWHDDTINPTLTEQSSAPSAPASGTKLFSRLLGGVGMSGQVNAAGDYHLFQPFMGLGKNGWASAQGTSGSTTINNTGLNTQSTGTITGRAITTTNYFTAQRRVGYVQTAGTNAIAGWRGNELQFFLGDSTNRNGFTILFSFGIAHASTIAGSRAFVGLYPNNASFPTASSNPTALTNIIGFGYDAGGNTSWKVISNDGSGTATTHVDLTSSFPGDTVSTDWYYMMLHADRGVSNAVQWGIMRVSGTGAYTEASGTISSDLPAANTLLNWTICVNSGTTNAAPAVDISHVYFRTE